MFGIFNVHTHMLMHAIAHGGYTETVKESALGGADSEIETERTLPHRGLEPVSVLRLVFLSDALPAELSPLPLFSL